MRINHRSNVGQAGTDMNPTTDAIGFEIFVTDNFCELDVSGVTRTLALANSLLKEPKFTWRFVSNMPGLVRGRDGMLVRTEPAIDDHGYQDFMVVAVSPKVDHTAWLPRVRAMQRHSRPVVLLADSATAYIKSAKALSGSVTTHWRDVMALNETGYHPTMTLNLAERAKGIVTAAGGSATPELIIALISEWLDAPKIGELGNQLVLQNIRKTDTEQPHGISSNEALFGQRITAAIKLMEDTISEPLSMVELTQELGISTRQLERQFREVFDDTPAKFYKRLRAKRARVMLEGTLLPILDVAAATGFGSSALLAKAVKEEFGVTPTRMRERKKLDLSGFD